MYRCPKNNGAKCHYRFLGSIKGDYAKRVLENLFVKNIISILLVLNLEKNNFVFLR